MDTTIRSIRAREILDSRGNPTVEVDVTLDGGAIGRAAVPSGASTGAHEAVELRDKNPERYGKRGVLRAVEQVNRLIAGELLGKDAMDQSALDALMIRLDGTPDKGRLGANAILGVSMAIARASATALGVPLHSVLGGTAARLMPVPMMNIINGGVHARWQGADFQEYMIVPYGAGTVAEAVRWGSETYHALQNLLRKRDQNTSVGDEGGFVPKVSSNAEPLDNLVEAIEEAGYQPGYEIGIALDAAASEFLTGDGYVLKVEDRILTAEEMIEMYASLIARYPIVSIEDGLAEDDWKGWKLLCARLGRSVTLVGDDLFVTNIRRIQQGIDEHAANSVLIKPNQIGTVTETIAAVRLAQMHGWSVIVSHRSGETVDPFIADLAVAVEAGRIKAGAPARGERVEKYNRLMRIEEHLGDAAVFAGKGAFAPETS
jgi:enolase